MQETNNINVYDYWNDQRQTFAKIRLQLFMLENKEKERRMRPTLSNKEIICSIFDKDGK